MSEKEIDESIFNEKSLNILNIKELRSLGKQLGVSSPASKSKKELIDFILKIVYGKEKPARTNLGRPTTRKFDIDKCLEKLRNTNCADDYKYNDYFGTKDYGFQFLSSDKKQYSDCESIEKRFFFRDGTKNYLRVKGFIDSKDDIEIDNSIVQKFNLENLDVVEIKRRKNFIKIYSINSVKVENNLSVLVDGKIVSGGSSQDFYFSTKEEITQNIMRIINNYEKKNIKIIIFAENEYKGDDLILFKYTKDENKANLYKKLMCLIDTCEKFATLGENLVVLIENKDEINHILTNLDDDIFERTKKYFDEVFTELTGVGNICISFSVIQDIKY